MKFDNDKTIKVGDKVKILSHSIDEKSLDLGCGMSFVFTKFDSEYFNKEGVVFDIKKSGVVIINLFEKDTKLYWPMKYLKKI